MNTKKQNYDNDNSDSTILGGNKPNNENLFKNKVSSKSGLD